jgi:hypothetical protein
VVASGDEAGSMEDVEQVDERETTTAADRGDGDGAGAGDVVIRADLAGTAVFAVTATLAAVLFTSFWQWVAAITALVLFAIGVFAFLWSYWNAVQRSRHDVISVSGLYLLLGDATPPRVRRTMLGTLLIQVVVAVTTTFARLDGPDGKPGSSLALGFLVPMLGFGLNGLWAAYHASFPPRPDVLPGATEPVTE